MMKAERGSTVRSAQSIEDVHFEIV